MSSTAPNSPSSGRYTKWNATLRTKAPSLNLSSTTSAPSTFSKDRKRREEDAMETQRIMDETYLPRPRRATPESPRRQPLHDIDHRPFPPISPRIVTTALLTPGDELQPPSQKSPGAGYKTVVKKAQTAPPAYWETFNLPQPPREMGTSCHYHFVSEPEEVRGEFDPFAYVPYRPPTPIWAHATATTLGYSDCNNTPSAPVGVPTSSGERRVLRRKSLAMAEDIDDRGEDARSIKDCGAEKQQDEKDRGRVEMSPKDILRRTWVATKFGVHLKVIRTQRWLKEFIEIV